MKILKTGTSLIESVIVILIITSGMVGAYQIFTSSSRLALTTKNRIEAIQIAREGIEAFTNIRDTNWLLYSADYKNCWNTLNYSGTCVGDISPALRTDINIGSYIIYKNPNNRWRLDNRVTGDYSSGTYRNNFRIKLDSDGLYTQSGGVNLLPIFTREIQVNYINTSGATTDSNDEKIEITSIVQWKDPSSKLPHKIELETILTNWKNKK